MGTTQPIKDPKNIEKMKKYFIHKGEIRNYVMFILGLNTSLRISDLLHLRWEDVYNFKTELYREHIVVVEQKTLKKNMIAINNNIIEALDILRIKLVEINPDNYIFLSRCGNNRPISRNRAFNIIKQAAEEIGLEANISCHSLRKTFGYQAWKQGVPPALLMNIYNHSSLEITKRYLSIDQDDKDRVFLSIKL